MISRYFLRSSRFDSLRACTIFDERMIPMKKIPMLLKTSRQPHYQVHWDINQHLQLTDDMIQTAVPTIKWDGTCVKYDRGQWFTRRTVKPGQKTPPNFTLEEYDPHTGKSFGWIPALESDYRHYFQNKDVLDSALIYTPFNDGDTFELIGPNIMTRYQDLTKPLLKLHGSGVYPLPYTLADIIQAIETKDINFLDALNHHFVQDNLEGLVYWYQHQPLFKLRSQDLVKLIKGGSY